jgi:CheY-like chemotaxis protein
MTAPDTRPAVLVIDDEADIRDIISELLEPEGYQVFTAANGREALELLPALPRLCLVLLDLMMPGLDGWTFFARARVAGALEGVPILAFTALGKPTLPEGIAGVLRKPLDIDGLLAAVKKYARA